MRNENVLMWNCESIADGMKKRNSALENMNGH